MHCNYKTVKTTAYVFDELGRICMEIESIENFVDRDPYYGQQGIAKAVGGWNTGENVGNAYTHTPEAVNEPEAKAETAEE